jgi:hypothetical protein
MELLGDVGRVNSRFGLFVDGVSISARLVHGLRQMYHMLRNRFGRSRWNSKVMWHMWSLVSVCSVIVLVWEQVRCTACAKCTVGSKIVLDALDGRPS